MKQFVASSPDVEVNGKSVCAIINQLKTLKTYAIELLETKAIIDIQPDHWYNQQAWLNVIKIISERLGNDELYAIGLRVYDNALFPSSINDVSSALAIIDTAYHMNHRNGEIDHYSYQRNSENAGTMICTNPYPDSLDQGIITSMAQKFNPNNTLVEVEIDRTKPIRDQGGDSTTFLICW